MLLNPKNDIRHLIVECLTIHTHQLLSFWPISHRLYVSMEPNVSHRPGVYYEIYIFEYMFIWEEDCGKKGKRFLLGNI